MSLNLKIIFKPAPGKAKMKTTFDSWSELRQPVKILQEPGETNPVRIGPGAARPWGESP